MTAAREPEIVQEPVLSWEGKSCTTCGADAWLAFGGPLPLCKGCARAIGTAIDHAFYNEERKADPRAEASRAVR